MLTLKGKYNTAKVFTDNIESGAISDLLQLLNDPTIQNTQVRIMPDVHRGKGSTIGTSIQLPEQNAQVIPNIVGGDMNCGMLAQQIKTDYINFDRLDKVINDQIPAGFDKHSRPVITQRHFDQLIKNRLSFDPGQSKLSEARSSLGTLGGGNHFIELDVAADGSHWLVVHSGSRAFGQTVNKHHQQIADNLLQDCAYHALVDPIIANLKQNHQQAQIQAKLATIQKPVSTGDYHQGFLTGAELEDYMNDALVTRDYADYSRHAMLQIITRAMNWKVVHEFTSVHNFVDVEHHVLRKGATPAYEGQRIIVPLNMHDGSIIGIGKGNPDWNNSAPHGAGRRLSRSAAKDQIKLTDFEHEMANIHTSSVGQTTLDEAPEAYKPAADIIDNIDDTMTITEIIKPIYNFKAH